MKGTRISFTIPKDFVIESTFSIPFYYLKLTSPEVFDDCLEKSIEGIPLPRWNPMTMSQLGVLNGSFSEPEWR